MKLLKKCMFVAISFLSAFISAQTHVKDSKEALYGNFIISFEGEGWPQELDHMMEEVGGYLFSRDLNYTTFKVPSLSFEDVVKKLESRYFILKKRLQREDLYLKYQDLASSKSRKLRTFHEYLKIKDTIPQEDLAFFEEKVIALLREIEKDEASLFILEGKMRMSTFVLNFERKETSPSIKSQLWTKDLGILKLSQNFQRDDLE